MNGLQLYIHWLHTQWPAGHVERLPEVDENGETNVPGIYVVGDLKGIPLLKFSLDSGTKAVRYIAASLKSVPPRPLKAGEAGGEGTTFPSPGPSPEKGEGVVYHILILGAGTAGMAAAVEARKLGLSFQILEASEPFSTIINFPKAKPIYTYPKEMVPDGDLKVSAQVKEALVEELQKQTKDIETTPLFAEKIQRKGEVLEVSVKGKPPLQARSVIVAIGRSGNFRKLNVPGENLDKVYNRLHDPKDFVGKRVLVVGGGDSAMETAIALTFSGAEVTLSYRQKEFSRCKPENKEQVEELARNPMAPVRVEEPSSERMTTSVNGFMAGDRKKGSLRVILGSQVKGIGPASVVLNITAPPSLTLPPPGGPGIEKEIPLPGGETLGEGSVSIPNDVVFTMIGRDAPLDFFRRSGIRISNEWTPARVASCMGFVLFCYFLYSWKSGGWLSDVFQHHHWFPFNLTSPHPARRAGEATFLRILSISASGPAFWYTLVYSSIVTIFGVRRIRRRKTPYVKLQTLILIGFQVLPLFLLPEIILPWLGAHHLIPLTLANSLFPVVTYGHGREYWRAYGLVLAWPLMIYNVFTHRPLTAWLVISVVQTFVLIPGLIYFFGKGAYCGWICSCGALAETLGDQQRTKMPHGPKWNRLNMAGQVILALAFVMLGFRIVGWFMPDGAWVNRAFDVMELRYKWTVDVGLAGILGVGLYFWYSGRVWCRFFCPLAALMHIYSRFSRFRILAEKKKCISCNVCTSVCHQGIDVMNFANKGLPMNDPQCVRCSACVQMCPTGVLSFGQVSADGQILSQDSLPASLIRSKEHI